MIRDNNTPRTQVVLRRGAEDHPKARKLLPLREVACRLGASVGMALYLGQRQWIVSEIGPEIRPKKIWPEKMSLLRPP